MSEVRPTNHLHLPDLSIEGFRGIDNLSIPRLGRVTLLSGENGVGKTTVLEACQIYATRGIFPILSDMVSEHEEFSSATDKDGDRISMPNLEALFHGRDVSQNPRIEIGPGNETNWNHLIIETGLANDEQLSLLESLDPKNLPDGRFRVLKIVFQDWEQFIPWPDPGPYRKWRRLINQGASPLGMKCVSLGPDLLDNRDVANFWDYAALTADEDLAVKALQLVLGETVDRVAMIGIGHVGPHFRRAHFQGSRRVIIKIRDHDRPVPLKSLGDGATRLLAVALALANSRDGFLLIDEAENGIHYSVQRDFWRMVLRTAHENNVQVLATTHGWDCIRGFAQAATEFAEADGVLVRLEKKNEEVRAIEYSRDELATAAEQGIEVR